MGSLIDQIQQIQKDVDRLLRHEMPIVGPGGVVPAPTTRYDHIEADAALAWTRVQDLTLADDAYIGLPGPGGRLVFDLTPAPDQIKITDADLNFVTAAHGIIHADGVAAGMVLRADGTRYVPAAAAATLPVAPVAVGDTLIATAGPLWNILTTPGAAGYARVSTATTEAWNQTPAWTGEHSFSAGIAFTGASDANEITIPDNLAIGFEIEDAGGLEYLRLVTTNAQPIIDFNAGGADVDFHIRANGVANALQVQGSDGQTTLGALGAGVVQSSAGGVLSSGPVPLIDLASYAEGSLIIGGAADWESLVEPGTAGFALVSDGTTFAWDQTPEWTGDHTWTSAVSARPRLTIENTNADAQAPTIDFYKNSASPAVSDDLGAFDFYGETSTGAKDRYAYWLAESLDVTNGATGGGMRFMVTMNGTDRFLLSLLGFNGTPDRGEVIINEAGQDVDFIVESAADADALIVQGSDSQVTLGGLGAGVVQSTVDGVLSSAAVPLADLAGYAEGSLVIGGAADWESLVEPGAAGYALVSDGTTFAWSQTPAWTGLHNFNAGLEIGDDQPLNIGDGADGVWTFDTATNRLTYSGVNVLISPSMGVGNITNAKFTVTASKDALSDLNDPGDYHAILHNKANDTGEMVGLGFIIDSGTNDVGGVVGFVRTGLETKGELRFYTKRSAVTATDPVLAMTLQDDGVGRFEEAVAIRATLANAVGLYVPWITGDADTTAYFGSTNASNDQYAIGADSYSAPAIWGVSVSNYGGAFGSTSGTGLYSTTASGDPTDNAIWGWASDAARGVYGMADSGVGVQGDSATGIAGRFNLTGAGDEILLCEDNGTPVFVVDDGGDTGVRTQTPSFAANAQGLDIAGTGGRDGLPQDGSERIPTLRITDTVTEYGGGTATVNEVRGQIEWWTSETSGNMPAVAAAIRVLNENTYNTDFGMAFYVNEAAASAAERMRINEKGFLGLATTNPGQIFDINSGSGNMIADGYDTHSLTEYKENIMPVADGGFVDKLKTFNLYEWTRLPFVSTNELVNLARVEFEIDADVDARGYYEGLPVNDPVRLWIDTRRIELQDERRSLRKYQRRHVGLVADDASTMAAIPNVISRNDDDEIIGYSLSNHVGFLHGAIRELVDRVKVLESAQAQREYC